MKQVNIRPDSILFISIMLALLSITWVTPSAMALPPRPTPAPANTPAKTRGGIIELHVEGITEGVWTMIQWQDEMAGWHDVEGWQGTLDEGNRKTWWVGEADLGTGPFRWVVTQDGDFLGMSESFYLPGSAGEKVKVSVLTTP